MKPLIALLLSWLVFIPFSLVHAETEDVGAQTLTADLGLRAFLGIGSIRADFVPDKNARASFLAVLKFENGKLVGIAPGGVDSVWKYTTPTAYKAELCWGKKDGKAGYVIVTHTWSAAFIADPAFDDVGAMTRYFANGRTPENKYGDYTILGYSAPGGKGGEYAKVNWDDPQAVIAKTSHCVVFVIKFFPSQADAQAFQNKVFNAQPNSSAK